MTHDPLGQLLADADAAAASTGGTSNGLAGRVRTELRRHRARARATIGMTALLLATATAIPIVRLSRTPPARPVVVGGIRDATVPPNGDELLEEIAALRREASAREAAVAAMLRAEARGRRPPGHAAIDPLARIRDQQDIAALALVRQADRLYHERALPQRAAAAYERVVEQFPQTPWAAVARQRLVEIKG